MSENGLPPDTPPAQSGIVPQPSGRHGDFLGAIIHTVNGAPAWLIYPAFVFQTAKSLTSSAVLGGATALYMNSFSGIAIYFFVFALILFFLWRLIYFLVGVIFRPIIRAFYLRSEPGSNFSRLMILSFITEVMKLLTFFLSIFAFTRYFDSIHDLNYDVEKIPVLRFFMTALESFEKHILESRIFSGTVLEIFSTLVSAVFSILILSVFGFRWSRKK